MRGLKPIIKESRTSNRYWAYVVGANMRRVRLDRGLTMDELAPMLTAAGFDISASGLSLLERNKPTAFRPRIASHLPGYVKVTIDRVMIIAQVLGVSYLELLREDTLRAAHL